MATNDRALEKALAARVDENSEARLGELAPRASAAIGASGCVLTLPTMAMIESDASGMIDLEF
jgi:hypothetical protein